MQTQVRPDVLSQAIDVVLRAYGNQGEKSLGFKHNATGVPATVGFMHGPGGLLTFPGVDPDVFTTMVGFGSSILNELSTSPSVYTNNVYEVITGISAGSGAEPTAICGPAPIGGVISGGKVTAPFGFYKRQTREVNIQRLGQRINRADPVDLRLLGSTGGSTPWTSSMFPAGNDILINEMSTVFWERAVALDRLLRKQIWVGNPANNHADGTYKEMAGFNLQLNTGWKDAETGNTLASLNPTILPFAFHRIDNGTYGLELVNKLQAMLHYAQDLAQRTGMMPVRWALAMRPALFYELTRYYACAYLTGVCSITNPTGGVYSQVIDNGDITQMRDEMRAGNFLFIEGQRIPVITDDAIAELNTGTSASVPSGCFASDIFLIPFSVMGGRSVTYLEYFDYGNPSITKLLAQPGAIGQVTANGAFFETMDQIRGCFVFQAEIQPRLVIRTPWLAGRITNVVYCPLLSPREPFPEDPYFVTSGEQARPGPSVWQPW